MASPFTLGIILKLIDKTTRPLTQIKRATENISRPFKELKREAEKATGVMGHLTQGVERLSKTIERAQRPFKALSERMQALKDTSQSLMMRGTATFLMGISPTVSAADFEKGLAEVSTLVDMGVEDFKNKYGKQVLDIAVELGEDPANVVRALYQAISSGITEPEEALKFLRDAGKAAIAGVSDIFTATDVLTTAQNAWKSFGYTTTQISDAMFVAVKAGKTTFNEIAQSLSEVSGIAPQAGIRLEELLAAMSTMTLVGDKTGGAFTGIKYALEALINPTSQAEKWFERLKIQVDANTLKQLGFRGTLEMISHAIAKYTKDEGERQKILNEIFSSVEGSQAVLKLTGEGAKNFDNILKQMTRSTGMTEEAFRKMESTTARAWSKFIVSLKTLVISLGNALLPSVNAILKKITPLINVFGELANRFPRLTQVILGGTIAFGGFMFVAGGLGYVMGSLVQGLMAWNTVISLLTTHSLRFVVALKTLFPPLGLLGRAVLGVASAVKAFSFALFTSPITWIIAGLTAIGIAAFLLWKHWDRVSKFLSVTWEKIKEVFSKGVEWLRANWIKALSVFLYTNPITAPIMALKKFVEYVFGIDLFRAGRKIIESLVSGLKSFAEEPIKVVKDIAGKIRDLLPFSPARSGPLRDIDKTGLALIRTIADSISPAPLTSRLNNVLELVKTKLSARLEIPTPVLATPFGGPARAFPVTKNITINVNVKGDFREKDLPQRIAKEVAFEIEKMERRKFAL